MLFELSVILAMKTFLVLQIVVLVFKLSVLFDI